jgi:tetratricopeptide (TPR) repeat protein
LQEAYVSDNDVPVTTESEEDVRDSTDADGSPQRTGNGGGGMPGELSAEERARLATLDEALQKFQAQKRWSDVIKTTLEKAELVHDPDQKVELFADAGRMYLERSSNQAEAIKCFRRVLEITPDNREAIERLKER